MPSRSRKRHSSPSRSVRRSKSGRRSRVNYTLSGQRPNILPVPERGVLSRFGYEGVKDTSDVQRHTALRRAIDAYGFRKTIGHLVLIANFTRRSDPAAYAIFHNDQQFVSDWYKKYKRSHLGSTRKSRRRSHKK